jgi:predicted amidohydrolase YtcJ
MRDALAAMHAVGITSFNDVWVGEPELQVYQAIERSGDLKMRIVNSIIDEGVFEKHVGADLERLLAARNDYASDLINNDSIKIMVDGVLEGETAALVEPYIGLDHSGVLNHSSEELRRRVQHYDAMGLRIHMHTIGDAAVRAGLDAIEYARQANAGNELSNDLRHTLSHLELVHPDDLFRFADLHVAASFTGAWAYPSTWVTELNLPVIGRERVDRIYPIGALHRAGAVVVGGSDWVYGPLDPLDSIEVAITRQDPDNAEGLVGNTRDSIDLATAIEAYTTNAAWVMHQEDKVGSIEVGKRADIVVLDRNLFEIPATEINEASVRFTLFDGEIVYRRSATD